MLNLRQTMTRFKLYKLYIPKTYIYKAFYYY